MKSIQLTQGKVALVDDADYEYLNQWKWHTLNGRSTDYAHAAKSYNSAAIIYFGEFACLNG